MFFKKSKNKEQEVAHNDIMPSDMSGFNELMNYIKEFSGVDLEQKRDITMQRLGNFAKNNGISTYAGLLARIKSNNELRQDILNLVTVNETYFYRELSQLKDVISYAKTLPNARILCAPCSSGDEVYSIAMLAYEANLSNSLISIMGIDINSEAISQCNAGEYSSRSLHRLSEEQKKQFFQNIGDKFIIKKSLLAKCEFKIVNVFDDALFGLGKFDIVLSRNMMIYFDDDFRLKCIQRLAKVLKSGGRLYAGHADLVPQSSEYEKKFINGSSFYERL